MSGAEAGPGEALKARQAPLKEKYRQDPGSALVTLEARGTLASGIACEVETWAGPVRAGLHPATGGDGSEACSGDMLLQALVACAGVTLRAVAAALGADIRSGSVHARGLLDFRGTLGVAKEVPVGFREIALSFELDTDAPQDRLDSVLRLTERYCVVLQTLRGSAQLTASIARR